jgi:hypothetical protein
MTKKIRITRTEVYEYEPEYDMDVYLHGSDAWEDTKGKWHPAIVRATTIEEAMEVDRYYLFEDGTSEEEIAGQATSVNVVLEIIGSDNVR